MSAGVVDPAAETAADGDEAAAEVDVVAGEAAAALDVVGDATALGAVLGALANAAISAAAV